MAKLVQIDLKDLTDKELNWMAKYVRDSWDRRTLKELLVGVRDDMISLWRIEDSPATGLLGISFHTGKDRVFWIEFLVGEGLMKDAIPIQQAIHEQMKLVKADRLEGIVSRPGLARLYTRALNMKPVAHIFREEFENG